MTLRAVLEIYAWKVLEETRAVMDEMSLLLLKISLAQSHEEIM